MILPPTQVMVAVFTLELSALAVTNQVVTHNTPREFPPVSSPAEWQARARAIREQALVSCGLWPMPERTPLQAHVFDRVEHGDYSVEKVSFQSWPGFYACGNLYRPVGKGNGPFPAVLNPHGHWANGRLTDVKDGSIPGRCINFAKRGMIAFAYDMVGYNDTSFANYPREGQPNAEFYKRHRFFATNAVCQLWGVSLMGLQTWNAIRGLDFLESLPDVDRKRLACTGASGGGTQTFMLGAIDDRLAVQAPVCMVSHSMQGGCSCENAPGLRVKYSNMEIAAAAAPRPQLLVAATGDWTKDTPTVEGPAVESIYRLFAATDNLRHSRFDSGHNYNQTSREAVYAWFERWLCNQPDTRSSAELPYEKPPDTELRVFPGDRLPADAVTDEQLIAWLIDQRRAQLAALQPHKRKEIAEFRRVLLPMWRHTLQVEWPNNSVHVSFKPVRTGDDFKATELEIRQDGELETIAATSFRSVKRRSSERAPSKVVVLAHTNAAAAYLDANGDPQGLAKSLLRAGHGVLVVTRFSASPAADPFANFYTTYNRTFLQHRVRVLLAVIAGVRPPRPGTNAPLQVVLHGEGPAGLWALLAAPAADMVVADAESLRGLDDAALLKPDSFCPGMQSMGGFQTAALLAAPHPLLLLNADKRLAGVAGLRQAYRVLDAPARLTLDKSPRESDILRWVDRF